MNCNPLLSSPVAGPKVGTPRRDVKKKILPPAYRSLCFGGDGEKDRWFVVLVEQTRERRRKKDEKVRNSQPREDYVGIIGDPEGNLASMARLFVRVVPRDRTKKHTANLRPAADLFAPRITATCISFAEMR